MDCTLPSIFIFLFVFLESSSTGIIVQLYVLGALGRNCLPTLLLFPFLLSLLSSSQIYHPTSPAAELFIS
jgi:hypothetical protein